MDLSYDEILTLQVALSSEKYRVSKEIEQLKDSDSKVAKRLVAQYQIDYGRYEKLLEKLRK